MKRLLQVFIVSGFCTLVVFGIHFIFPSMITYFRANFSLSLDAIGTEYLEETVRYHHAHEVYARRPITSLLVINAVKHFDLSYAWAFIGINFFLLFVCGYLVYILARSYSFSHNIGLFSICTFFASYTILLAFFSGIYTYDEPIQYLALFSALIFLEKKLWWFFGFSLFISLLARETSALLFPSFFFILAGFSYVRKKQWKNLIHIFLVLIVPLFLYAATLFFILTNQGLLEKSGQYVLERRFIYLPFNFQSFQYTLEVFVLLFVVILFPLFIAYQSIDTIMADKSQKKALKATLLALAINTPIVFIGTRAREARLLALPLVFLWSLMGSLIHQSLQKFVFDLKKVLPWFSHRKLRSALWILLLLFLTLFLAFFSFHVYKPTLGGNSDFGFRAYLFVILVYVTFSYLLPVVQKNVSSYE